MTRGQIKKDLIEADVTLGARPYGRGGTNGPLVKRRVGLFVLHRIAATMDVDYDCRGPYVTGIRNS